jgi:hypothetical protein
MTLALAIVRFVELYLVIGLIFASWFAWRGAARFDAVAGGGSIGFRLLIVPGAALLWPYLLLRLARMSSTEVPS